LEQNLRDEKVAISVTADVDGCGATSVWGDIFDVIVPGTTDQTKGGFELGID
jgi:hypothetical protein